MSEDPSGVVLQRLVAIDGKLTLIAREQRETTDRIVDVQRSQAELKSAIRAVSASVAATHARMADVNRTAQQLRADFREFREQFDSRLATLTTLINSMSVNIVSILQVIEREDLRRAQQLQFRNVVHDAHDLLNSLRDRVVRYIAATHLQTLFNKHSLTVRTFDDISDRQFFGNTSAAMHDAIAAATPADLAAVAAYGEALEHSRLFQQWINELGEREADVSRRNDADEQGALHLATEAARIRQNATALETAARQRAKGVFAVTVVLFAAVGLLAWLSVRGSDEAGASAALIAIIAIALGIYGVVKYHYSAAQHAAKLEGQVAQLKVAIAARSSDFRDWQTRIRAALQVNSATGEDIEALRSELSKRLSAAGKVCARFLSEHPELQHIA
jgi:hypothetical protein